MEKVKEEEEEGLEKFKDKEEKVKEWSAKVYFIT